MPPEATLLQSICLNALTYSFFTIPSALAIFALSAMAAMVNPTVFSGGDFNF